MVGIAGTAGVAGKVDGMMGDVPRKGNVLFLSLEGISELSERNHGKAPKDIDEAAATSLLKQLNDKQLTSAFRSGKRLLELMAQQQLDETGSLQPQALCEQSAWTDKLLNEMELRDLLREGVNIKASNLPPLEEE